MVGWSPIAAWFDGVEMRLPAVLIAFLCFASSQAYGATITKSENDLCVLKLEGEILAGDFDQFQRLAAIEFKGVDGESSSADTICLNSPGGSLLEGVRLAEHFYKNGVGTVIGEDAECYSICAIMFMMGIAQGPEVNFANRKLHITGRLGFHRPYLALDSDELVSARALPVAHDMALESIMKILILANNHVPWSNSTMMRPDLVQAMLTHIGNDLYYIDTVEKAGRFEVELFGYETPKSLTEEQAYYACENAFHWQVGLIGKDTDYQALVKTYSEFNGGTPIVEPLQDKGGLKIFSVTSGDAGYSEAGCLIGYKDDYVQGCGYNGMYNVSVGQGECTVENFDDRSVYISRLATYQPSLAIAELGRSRPQIFEAAVGAAVRAICVVISPDNAVEQEPCTGSISENIVIAGKRADRFEFTWPTGNKTIVMRDGDNFSVNGKPAFLFPDERYTLCAVNTESKNRFCFKM